MGSHDHKAENLPQQHPPESTILHQLPLEIKKSRGICRSPPPIPLGCPRTHPDLYSLINAKCQFKQYFIAGLSSLFRKNPTNPEYIYLSLKQSRWHLQQPAHVIFDFRQLHRRVAHLDAQQLNMFSQTVWTGGTVLSSAIKCSTETFHPYSSTEGIMRWVCKAFGRSLTRCGAYPA